MRPLALPAAALATLLLAACGSSGGGTPAPAGCTLSTSAGTAHSGDVTASTTWTAAASPHTVASSFSVAGGATLTLEACAVVRLGSGVKITVSGSLLAAGQAGRPVAIDSTAAGIRWGYLTTRTATGVTTLIDLAHTALTNGGLTDVNGLGVIDLRGDSASPRQGLLRVNDVTIDGSAGAYGFGVVLREGAAFTADSTALTIKNAAAQPVYAQDRLSGSVPPGSYTGNGIDEILVVAAPTWMWEDTTWHDRGIPYRVGDSAGNGKDLRVGLSASGSPVTTLTVDAGVTVRVSPAGRILLTHAATGTTGSLVALGTASRPVVFTSASPAPAAGDWAGLRFDGAPAAASRLDHVVVQYAGGPSQANSFHCDPDGTFSDSEDSAILVFGEPASAFVTNSTVSQSAGAGIDLAYTGSLVDMLATNTFSGVVGCSLTRPRPVSGSCPVSPCP